MECCRAGQRLHGGFEGPLKLTDGSTRRRSYIKTVKLLQAWERRHFGVSRSRRGAETGPATIRTADLLTPAACADLSFPNVSCLVFD